MEQKTRNVNEIAKEFNKLMHDLIIAIERKTRSDLEAANLDRLRKRISCLKSTLGDASTVSLAAPFFINFSEIILNPNEAERDEFFLTMDVRAEYLKYNSVVSKQDEFVFELSDSIRKYYKSISASERVNIYNKVTSMLRCAIEYKMLSQSNE